MSRSDARTESLRRRPARTVPASVVSVVLLAAGVALVWIAVLRLANGSWPDQAAQSGAWIAALSWGSVALLLICLGAAVLGLILLVAAVKPGAPTAYRMQSGPSASGTSADVVMSRASIAKLATARAGSIDGVDGVSASVGARKVTITVRTPSAGRADLEHRVHEQVHGALQAAGLDPVPGVAVTARTHQP